MDQEMKEFYKIERTCAKCGNKQELRITKREAAFELVDFNQALGQRCEKCSAKNFITSLERPKMDFELLKEWSLNSALFLMPQDEELLLADERYLDMILQILDTVEIPEHKRNLLMDSLCVIVYDNTVEDNPQKDDQLKQRVIAELNSRKDKLKLADDWIPVYLKEVVYPQLDKK